YGRTAFREDSAMRMRSAFATLVVLAGLSATVPAFALELREPRAHFVVDIPNNWTVTTDGDYAMAHPKDQTFHLRMIATDKGPTEEAAAEQHLLTFLGKHFNDLKVDKHGKRIDFNNFIGVEIFGTGKEKSGAPGRFFALVLVDKKNTSKGAVV